MSARTEQVAGAFAAVGRACAQAAEAFEYAGYPLLALALMFLTRVADAHGATMVMRAAGGIEEAEHLPPHLRELGGTLADAAACVCMASIESDPADSLCTAEQCFEEIEAARDAEVQRVAAQGQVTA